MQSVNGGLFVTFEGGEGAGKSTLISALSAKLVSYDIPLIKTREPGGTPFGQQLRDILLNSKSDIDPMTELLLFSADRSYHVNKVIQPALKAKKVVLCDRYIDSTYAYQAASGASPDIIDQLTCIAAQNTLPDLTFLLDLDPREGLKRVEERSLGRQDRMEQRILEFHQQLRQTYLKRAEKEPERFCVLDATLSPNQLLDHAFKRLKSCLGSI